MNRNTIVQNALFGLPSCTSCVALLFVLNFVIHFLSWCFPCVWLQHLRVIQIPTLPILKHLETLQSHPIWAHHPHPSHFHQVSHPHYCSLLKHTHTHVHTHSLWYVSFTLNPLCPLGVSSLYLKRCCWVLCHWKYLKWVCCVSSIPMFNMYEAEKKSLLDCNSFHITFSNIIFAILHL